MSNYRKIKKIIAGRDGMDGAGVKLVRLFSAEEAQEFDPFLMMDAFDSISPTDYERGFPWHPHRGIETITYLIDGNIEHQDSLGNRGVINSGGAQWMTAGSGIIHNEMPQESDRMRGFQLWLNLPKEHKMTSPSYGDIHKDNIPVIKSHGAEIRVVSGDFNGEKGAFEGGYVKPTFLDISLEKDSHIDISANPEETVFIYIVDGHIAVNDSNRAIALKNVVLFDTGESIRLSSKSENSRILYFGAKPLKEPIAWGGPIVMNTEAELQLAFAQLQRGTFIKHSSNSTKDI